MPYGDWRGSSLDSLKYGHYIKLHKYVNDIKGYYPHVKTLKKEVLRFKRKDMAYAFRIFQKLNPKNHTMVSIHVRLTDYIRHLIKLYQIHTYLSGDYLRNAMEYFVNKYKVGIIKNSSKLL